MSNQPPPNAPYSPPPPAPQGGGPQHPHPPGSQGDSTGGVIPYKNPKALVAYYLGIFSLFPALGFPLGIASIWLGVLGLKARNRDPIIKGHVHAWIGIVLGVIGMPLHLLVGLGVITAIVSG
ncbi:hypothetical protein [Roseimaritima ulvae]|uniref:DUF4190 domain-containing protein n=1 Tax=Roseimaritima ulvae TaxID=980254 RepID=A0A5B9QZC9_9BACT|nr:hypothetical protein [Roseimaritima ulvae]QEG43240.1 hypothetical protein UC8_52860 [Roseimaritima ulvae]